jgi:protein-L-isoaspartate(D-aspartate) O-methyltransferase
MSSNLEIARQQMVDQQLHTWDVFDQRVLDVVRALDREKFVPEAYRKLAFADTAIPLSHGQLMLPPKIVGRILQALAAKPDDVVLEVGTGSGFLSACLGRLASRVSSLEIVPELAQQATTNLQQAAVNNVVVRVADGMQLDAMAAYDAIALTGSLPIYDERFQNALKQGGRLFVVVGEAPLMEAWCVTRIGQREWQRDSLFETVLAPLTNAPRPSPFVF